MGQPESILKPSNKIIGSELTSATPSYEKEKEYNANINKHEELMSRIRIKDNFVMVRFFKYDKDPISDGGILLKDMKDDVTEGGRKTSKLVNSPYQKKAVVVLLADNLSKLDGFPSTIKVGDIVHMSQGSYYEFHIDKSVEVDKDHGYCLVHVAAIDCVETN